MLKSWLDSSERTMGGSVRVAVTDLHERSVDPEKLRAWLGERLRTERFHQELANDLIADLGWPIAAAVLAAGMPSLPRVRKGVLGEVLAAECAIEFDGWIVPVKKLRSMIASGESLHGTDVLAFRVSEDDSIVRARYIEAKLRTTCDRNAAVNAEEQLERDMEFTIPQILLFVANQLYESDDPFKTFLRQYMHARAASADTDEFRVHLTWETDEWSENVLDRLEAADPRVAPLSLAVVLVAGLNELTAGVYSDLGLSIDHHDD